MKVKVGFVVDVEGDDSFSDIESAIVSVLDSPLELDSGDWIYNWVRSLQIEEAG